MPLMNTQYEEITRDYNRRQLQNRREQEERMKQVYEKIPRIREIEKEEASISARKARSFLLGETNQSVDLKRELALLKEEKECLLLNYGFSKDYMQMRYQCPICKDTGYVNNDKCKCFKRKVIDLLYTQSNLKEILKEENFDTFSYLWYDDRAENGRISPLENMKRIAQYCLEMTINFGNHPQNILFTGTSGTGKTFLTHCIAKELIDACFSVIYLSATEFFDILSRQKFENEDSMDTQYLLDCDLLIVDDLGTELSNSFTVSRLFYCINERVIRKKAMIISTNLSLNMLRDLYTERITSRLLSDFKILELYGADIRLQKMIKRHEDN
jgi:DNA replication protein DnaC